MNKLANPWPHIAIQGGGAVGSNVSAAKILW